MKLLPFSYATRNLLRDPSRFLQKTGGAAVVVLLVFAAGAFNAGMESLLRASGSERNVILLGAGSEESIERSEIAVQTETLATAGIAGIETRMGIPAVSGEVHFMGEISGETFAGRQALLRGVRPAALEVHREVRLLEGRFPGSGEVIVGKLAHHTLGVESRAIVRENWIQFEEQEFRVVGIFEAPGTVMESEIWFDRGDLMTLTQRETLSCVVVRLEDPTGFGRAELFSKQRLDLELTAIRESDYYGRLGRFFGPIRQMTWLTAGLIAAGAVFGGFNMLYAAFASRIRELATLQAIGFSRRAVFLSLLQESLVGALSGTLLAAFLAIFLIDGQAVYFSIGTFALTLSGGVIGAALLTGVLLGVLGAISPAIRCLGSPLPTALRS